MTSTYSVQKPLAPLPPSPPTTVNLLIDKDKKGVILDNMQIVSNNPDNKYDLTFNRVNNLESASTTYKVGDEYKVKELKLKIEGLGYTCK